jgi:hypothetical protein
MHGHTQLNNLVISTGGVMGPWVTQGDEKALRSSNHSLWNRCPFLCHPERTRISYFTALSSATYVVLPKENHMQLTEAATLDRKSGEAEGSAVPRTSRGNVFRQSAVRWRACPGVPWDLRFLFVSHTPSLGQRYVLYLLSAEAIHFPAALSTRARHSETFSRSQVSLSGCKSVRMDLGHSIAGSPARP